MKIKKGNIIKLNIESLSFGGSGFAKHDGAAIFVEKGLPGQEVEAFQELATRSILRTGYGDGSKGSIQVKRMPLSFMWTYGELQDNLMTQFIISRLPCMLIINPNKRYYSIRYGKIPLETEPLHKFLYASLTWWVKS